MQLGNCKPGLILASGRRGSGTWVVLAPSRSSLMSSHRRSRLSGIVAVVCQIISVDIFGRVRARFPLYSSPFALAYAYRVNVLYSSPLPISDRSPNNSTSWMALASSTEFGVVKLVTHGRAPHRRTGLHIPKLSKFPSPRAASRIRGWVWHRDRRGEGRPTASRGRMQGRPSPANARRAALLAILDAYAQAPQGDDRFQTPSISPVRCK